MILLIVAAMCLSQYGFDGEHGEGHATLHIITSSAPLIVLALKVAVVRWWHGLRRLLPLFGTTVFVVLGITWLTSAGDILW